jgi:hypothetical protein
MSEDKKIFASPKVRKFARELGANVSQIKGTERKGRITEEDVKFFISIGNKTGISMTKVRCPVCVINRCCKINILHIRFKFFIK